MPALTAEQRDTVNRALDFLQQIIDCYDALPADARTVPSPQRDEIERAVDRLRELNRNGQIDFASESSIAVLARTDRRGIHLNSNFGGDYRNDYDLPADYMVDNCEEGYFYSLWRLIEILMHELFHYEHHSGVIGSANVLFLVVVYGTVGNLLEGASGLFARLRGQRRLVRKYAGHEHQAYSYAYWQLGWLDHLLFAICFDDSDCIPCCEQHSAQARAARERQNPYEWR